MAGWLGELAPFPPLWPADFPQEAGSSPAPLEVQHPYAIPIAGSHLQLLPAALLAQLLAVLAPTQKL